MGESTVSTYAFQKSISRSLLPAAVIGQYVFSDCRWLRINVLQRFDWVQTICEKEAWKTREEPLADRLRVRSNACQLFVQSRCNSDRITAP